MNSTGYLQPTWDFLVTHMGSFISSPGFLLCAVILGIYVPGILFSIVDVATKRLTVKECFSVYWRAMKVYSSLYVIAMVIFITVPLPIQLNVSAEAPTLFAFFRDLVLYFLLGDFVSYWWHRIEHLYKPYMQKVHSVHHFDKPPLSIWTAMVVHPIEGFSVFAFFHLYGLLFPIHVFTWAVAAFAMTAVTMITHCGYRLPVYDWIFASSPGHDFHHGNRKPTNISVVFSICDRLFGTYQKPGV